MALSLWLFLNHSGLTGSEGPVSRRQEHQAVAFLWFGRMRRGPCVGFRVLRRRFQCGSSLCREMGVGGEGRSWRLVPLLAKRGSRSGPPPGEITR